MMRRFAVSNKLVSRKAVLIAAPMALLVSMHLVFNGLVALFGIKLGYFLGFVLYWSGWCTLLPLWLVGKNGLSQMFAKKPLSLAGAPWLGETLLWLPPAFTLLYALPLVLPRATILVVLASLMIAVINATLEEVLWRGLYTRVFPENPWLGYLYPALGFAVWHYAPQSILANQHPGGAHSLVVFALFLGLTWGWVAWRTGSIRWTTLAHIILDFSGLGALFYFS